MVRIQDTELTKHNLQVMKKCNEFAVSSSRPCLNTKMIKIIMKNHYPNHRRWLESAKRGPRTRIWQQFTHQIGSARMNPRLHQLASSKQAQLHFNEANLIRTIHVG